MSNYKQMDQTSWQCFEFPGKSYYYGQTSMVDQGGVILSKDSPDALNPKNKYVKHGFGIYIYNVANNDKSTQYSRYEGNWDRDRKHGQGKLIIPGQFTYEGEFKDGLYHDYGKMVWTNGDSYQGNWKKSRMQGGGIFKHHDGFILKGSFKANHFVEDNVLRNPQMSEKEYQSFKKQRKEVLKQKERNEKIKHGFITKVNASENSKILELCTKSNHNNRVPLIISSENSKFNHETLEDRLKAMGKTHTFDLRKAYQLKDQQKYNYKNSFSQMTKEVLKNGGSLIINLDQSKIEYKQAFYPQLREFYDANGFNNNTWSRQAMKRKQLSDRLIGGQVNPNYLIAVWSKVKLPEQLSEDHIREKMQLRFESILPFIKIDIIFVVSDLK